MAKGDSRLGRRPKNMAEGEFFELATRQGWFVTRRGWPDFFCFREVNGKPQVMLVECKANISRHLRREQTLIFNNLSALGIQCFMWAPDKATGGLWKCSKWGYPDQKAEMP